MIEVKNLTKTYGNHDALCGVSFKIANGKIYGLLGPNGAGKSTLMNVLSGTYPYGSYEGQILYDGEECKFKDIKDNTIVVSPDLGSVTRARNFATRIDAPIAIIDKRCYTDRNKIFICMKGSKHMKKIIKKHPYHL